MLLGTRNYAQNDVRKIVINYCDWLLPGYVLSAVTASITPTTGIVSTVAAPTLDPTEKVAFVPLTCGGVNESFTLNIQATDTFGQIINDQININVVAPGAT
jgi:hypothetical protein